MVKDLVADIPGRLRLQWWILTRLPFAEQPLADETGGIERLDRYKSLLDEGTWDAARMPAVSRYESFRFAFKHFEKYGGKVIVELGTIRSFVHEGHPINMRIGIGEQVVSAWLPLNAWLTLIPRSTLLTS